MNVAIVGSSEVDLVDLKAIYTNHDFDKCNYEYIYQNQIWFLKSKLRKEFTPFSVDFSQGTYKDISLKAKSSRDPLVKALGKVSSSTHVLDLTAGWLKDSWRIIVNDIKVTAIENQPLVYNFLKLSIENQIKNSLDESFKQKLRNLKLIYGESSKFISENTLEKFDIIYIDPMFPDKKKKALAGKELQLLQDIVGLRSVGEELVSLALKTTVSRVIVKRPLNAPKLVESVTFQVEGKSARFDVYVKSS
jgi:16S rRNA (guanine1516-N2)-methyltransferase